MEYFIMALVVVTIGMIVVTVFQDLAETATIYSINIRDCELENCDVCAHGAFANSFEKVST